MAEHNNMFLIPLDGIDLNYLKTTLKMPNGKVMPLWSNSNLDMRKNEYYEFKFSPVKKENDDSVDNVTGNEIEDSDIEIHYTQCCICDIDVPLTFLNEHYDSAKHQINLKIANTALERVKNSVNINKKVTNSSRSQYFCPVCVIVVEMKKKRTHNKSVLHKNAVALENIYEQFSNLYAKSQNDDSDDSEDDSEFYDPVKETVNSPKSTKDTQTREIIFENSCTVNENKGIPIVKTSDKFQENKKINDKIDVLEKDLTSNFEKLMMHFDTIPTNKNKIDYFTENTRNSKDTEINSTDKSSINGNLKINKHNKNIDGNKRKIVKNYILEEIDTKNDKEDSRSFKMHHHLEMTSFYVYCKVCKKNIDFNDFEHTVDLKHEINYEKFIEENSLYRKDSRYIECRICNVSFIYEDEISHCNEIKHITNYERFKKRNG